MRIDHEDHRESSHRINVFYTLLRHFNGKDTEKRRNSWLFGYKNVFLPNERKNHLDRLG